MNLKYAGIVVSTLVSSNIFADTLFVSNDGVGIYCERLNPCGRIQTAVDLANSNDLIIVGSGVYTENVVIPQGKDGLSIIGKNNSTLVSAGGRPGVVSPQGVALDVALDIFSKDISIRNLNILHPVEIEDEIDRDIGVFARPSALNLRIAHSSFRRNDSTEPSAGPGSRGALIFQATGAVIKDSLFTGNYQDHVHIPASGAVIANNRIYNATRLGVVVIQETENSVSSDNIIRANRIVGNVSHGVEIQGDNTIVLANIIKFNGGAGVKLCGPGTGCVPPADSSNAVASDNIVIGNKIVGNAGGDVVDDGENNIVR